MRIPDEAMPEYYRLLLGAEPPGGAARTRRSGRWPGGSSSASTTPAAAAAAEEHFNRLFVEREAPEEVEELDLGPSAATTAAGPPAGADGRAPSGSARSEARRLIEQGGVKLDGEPLAADTLDLAPAALDGRVLQVGKRRFRRLRARRLRRRLGKPPPAALYSSVPLGQAPCLAHA